jgi:hypothetical protein
MSDLSRTRDEAYDQIDRFLRNNMDDADYAEYSQALDCVYAAESSLQKQPEPTLAKRLQAFRDLHWTHWTAEENQLVVDCFHALRSPVLHQQEVPK